jgi:hypothetical protein
MLLISGVVAVLGFYFLIRAFVATVRDFAA